MQNPGLIGALIGGLVFGVIFGLVSGGLAHRVKVDKTSPNQGIKLSLRNSLGAALVTWFIVGLILAFMNAGLGDRLSGLGAGLGYGLIVGLIVGLNRGGSAVIKHYALCLILWLNGYTPFRFVEFLDGCAMLIFLKKVGGGYIFIHRMLLNYFADLPSQAALNTSAVGRK